ncbi:trigger factor [Panacagrimonas perspica]|uniref:Trigger factor n=1 Tax=Panacagrimonas perspica TaxID=381431 RepID=A0A4R7P9M9_9GAMM|nr:trigger factor [Panacagrimonas perspica]TDU30705.1 trigger factor [Panacagrimonas perspica]THD01534.1 trigger factor [Panacagrimonas perspica]
MDVNLETPGGLLRQMRVTIPADRVSKAVDERLRTMSQRAKLPGFRPGKAPLKVIQQQFGPSARMDAVSDLVQRSYPEALVKVGVRPAGQPQINVTFEKPGEALEYVASFEVFPEIQLSGLDALEIEQPVVEVTEADVERLVLNLRKGRRVFNTVTRAAASGDMVKLDFDGKLEGESFQGGKGDGVEIELGAGQFLADLENGVVGHSAGDEFVVPVNFPADYRAEELKGKTAQFAVKLHEVKEVVLPAIEDAEFLAAHKVDSVDALHAKAREALENEREKAIQRRKKNQVMEQLATTNPIEVPKSLVQQEVPNLRQQAAQRMNMQNVPPEQLAEMLPAQLFEANASRKVALGLLLGEVVKQRDVKLDVTKVDVALDAMARDFEQPEQVKTYYRSRPEMMDGLRAMVLEDQVVDLLLEGARKVDKPMSLEQLLNPQAQA